MAEIKKVIKNIDRVEAGVKLVEEKEDGEVVDRILVTVVKLQFNGTPAIIDDILWALKAGQPISVAFFSSQLKLDTIENLVEAGNIK